MKSMKCFVVVFATLVIALFSSCADTPKEGGGIGAEFFVDANQDSGQPDETVAENTDSYENADKLSEEDAKALFVKLNRTAALSMFGGGSLASGAASGSRPDPITLMHAVDKTTKEIWEKFKVQVFTFDNKTYFVRDKIFVHVNDSTFQKYCIMDFGQNQIPDLVFIGKCPTTYPDRLKLNFFTEDLEIYKLFESSEVFKNSLINDIEKIDDLTLKIVGKKSSSLTYDSTKENPEFTLIEITEEKE